MAYSLCQFDLVKIFVSCYRPVGRTVIRMRVFAGAVQTASFFLCPPHYYCVEDAITDIQLFSNRLTLLVPLQLLFQRSLPSTPSGRLTLACGYRTVLYWWRHPIFSYCSLSRQSWLDIALHSTAKIVSSSSSQYCTWGGNFGTDKILLKCNRHCLKAV